MKITACSGDCIVCANWHLCSAEPGDDYYSLASKKELYKRIAEVSDENKNYIIKTLVDIEKGKRYEF